MSESWLFGWCSVSLQQRVKVKEEEVCQEDSRDNRWWKKRWESPLLKVPNFVLFLFFSNLFFLGRFYIYLDWERKKLMCIFIVWKQLETSVPSFDWSLEVMFHLNLYLWDHFVISISSWQIFYIYFDWKWKKLYVFIMWKQLETNILSIWMIVREVMFHLNLHLWDHFVISISSWQILYICLDWKWKKLMCIFIMWKHLWDHFVISISSWQYYIFA